tara:strand:+ start:133 stop:528 length:396 start_codon:yes stop_codon:yes gene_type:complete
MATVSQLRPKFSIPQLDATNIATAQLFRDRWHNRVTALGNCIAHLVNDHGMPEHAAETAALQAYAEIESVNQKARIDVDATTSHLVVLRSGDGRSTAFTVSDLLRLLDRARQEGGAAVIEHSSRQPVVLEH